MLASIAPVVGILMALSFAVPSLAMGLRLLHVWRRPLEIEDGSWVSLGVGVMVMEFILVHAGVALASVALSNENLFDRVLITLGLVGFYGVFALAISAAFKSRMLLESFLWMIGGRLLALIIGISAEEADLILAYSLLSMGVLMPIIFVSGFLPFPRLGITSELAQAHRLVGARGLWFDEPHRAIGAGAIYFLALGAATLGMMGGFVLCG